MSQYHVIKDPVHGTMQFTGSEHAWVKPFIDSPHFQRLRHIKQAGMGDYIFPGAVHTRFNHCLGCCYVASQIAQKIGLADTDRQLVMIACLLHDIGHGPFSHAFEGIFDHYSIRHEAWTPYFLQDYATEEFFSAYNALNPRHQLSSEKFQDIAAMIMHKTTQKSVLADIVSSQLDADRLDYLLRDSHFCGVRYGEFDFRWMLHCLAIVKSHEGNRLGITHKGLGVVEHYLMARRLMTRNIYQSQKKLALEALMVKLLKSLADKLEIYEPYAFIRDSRLGQFLIAANRFNQTILGSSNKEKARDAFLADNYANYKELCDFDVYSVMKQLSDLADADAASQIAMRIQQRVMPKTVRLALRDLNAAENSINEFLAKHKQYQDWQVLLITTPHQSYSGEEDPILVLDEFGVVKPIGQLSAMLHAIADRYEHVAFLCIDKVIAEDKAVLQFIERLQHLPAVA